MPSICLTVKINGPSHAHAQLTRCVNFGLAREHRNPKTSSPNPKSSRHHLPFVHKSRASSQIQPATARSPGALPFSCRLAPSSSVQNQMAAPPSPRSCRRRFSPPDPADGVSLLQIRSAAPHSYHEVTTARAWPPGRRCA
jgi:hypothetical protein